jgi:PAS domain S-box-containing protein
MTANPENSEPKSAADPGGFRTELERLRVENQRLRVQAEKVAEANVHAAEILAELETARAALEGASRQTESILNAAGEGIFGVDVEGRVTFINPAAVAILGWEKEEILGEHLHELSHHTRPDGSPYPACECPIYEAYKDLGIHRIDNEVFWRKDGTSLPVEYISTPIRDANGRSAGAVVSFQDITERRRAQAELDEARKAAEAASLAKSQFLANMSHEIRTPMNGVLGMTELLLETELTTEQRDYATMVKSSADTLLSVINDILDVSKMEAGRLELEHIPFGLRGSLAKALKPLALEAQQKGLELTFDTHPDVPEYIVGDPTRVRQIIINLVGNAIKFTSRGEVGLEIAVETRQDNRATLHFTVHDTGIGIAPEKQKVIFDAFAQADSTMTRKYGGTGLGLTISSRLVEMLGGRIWVESRLSEGSHFHFTIDVEVSKLDVQSEQVDIESLRRVRVLVVDDNATNRQILHAMLQHWGMEATLATSGAEGIEALTKAMATGTGFGLILLDAHMPEMDGFTLVEEIRNLGLKDISTVMLTSGGLRGDAARCRELGVASYLSKPVSQSQLLEALLSVFGDKVRSPEGPRQLVTRHSLQDLHQSLKILLAEDNAVNQTLAVRLLQKLGHSVVVAGNGRESLAALEKEDFDAILMDVQMPEMDGFEATAAIREREKLSGSHVPILAMTAHAMQEDRDRCLAAGMDGYIAKPISVQDLIRTIQSLPQNGRRPKGSAVAPLKPGT